MELSIVIVALNEEDNIARCLRSIRAAHGGRRRPEVIVVDGGSVDRTVEVAVGLGATVVHADPGIPRQRNLGAGAASGDVLAYLDADCEILPGWFEAVERYFAGGAEHDGRALILGSPPRLPADAGWVARAYAMHWGASDAAAHDGVSFSSRLLSTQSLVMARDTFERLGGFREELLTDEDTDLLGRARAAGVEGIADGALAYIHHGEPRTLGEFFRRMLWHANYWVWLGTVWRSGLRAAMRPQYLYGIVVAGAVATTLGGMIRWLLGAGTAPMAASAMVLAVVIVGPAMRTAVRRRAPQWLPQLVAIYGAYGLAHAAALLGLGRRKARRWR